MTIKIKTDSSGRVLEVFKVGVSPDIPADAITLTDTEAQLISAAVCFGDYQYSGVALTFVGDVTSRIALKREAQAALDKSDKVAIRCAKAGVVYPPAWQARDVTLRAIVSGSDTTTTTIETEPAYPSGT